MAPTSAPAPASWLRRRCARRTAGPAAAREPPEQAQLAIEQRTRVRAVDLPSPRLGDFQGASDLASTAMRHIEESSRVSAMPTATLGEVEHDARSGALDLIGCVSAVGAELGYDGAQRADQIQCDIIRDEHVRVLLGALICGKGTPRRRPPRRGYARRDR